MGKVSLDISTRELLQHIPIPHLVKLVFTIYHPALGNTPPRALQGWCQLATMQHVSFFTGQRLSEGV